MSKIALCTDFHFGASRNSDIILDSQMRFFKNQFAPYLKQNAISDVFFLGDIFDCRNNINLKIMNAVYDLFENYFNEFNIHVLVGNHDLYLRTSTHINSLKFFNKFSNVTVYENTQEIELFNRKILMVPWITNYDDFIDFISKHQGCDICFGHFELNGFKIDNKQIFNHENTLKCESLFDNFKLIFSGHFHTRSALKRGQSTIQYIGNAYQLTRNDIDDDRGFCILDTETLKYEFVNNTESLKFIKIKYPNKPKQSDITGNIIDIEVDYDETFDEVKFKSYMNLLESFRPASTPTPRFNNKMITQNINTIDFSMMNVKDIIKEYIDSINIKNKKLVMNKIEELHRECKIDIL